MKKYLIFYTTDGTLLFYTAYTSKVTQLNKRLTLKLLLTPNHIKHYLYTNYNT